MRSTEKCCCLLFSSSSYYFPLVNWKSTECAVNRVTVHCPKQRARKSNIISRCVSCFSHPIWNSIFASVEHYDWNKKIPFHTKGIKYEKNIFFLSWDFALEKCNSSFWLSIKSFGLRVSSVPRLAFVSFVFIPSLNVCVNFSIWPMSMWVHMPFHIRK